MNKFVAFVFALLFFLRASPALPQTGCMGICPVYAGCVGTCIIDAPEDSTCSAVCTATCGFARCQLFGGPECVEAEEEPCEKRPAKRTSRSDRSPLESPWAVIEVDERSEFSTEARGVLAASTKEHGQEAWAGYWRRQYLSENTGSTNPSKRVRTVFIVDRVAYEPIEPRFWLVDSDIRPELPRRSRFYFRGATRGDGVIALVEPLFTTAPGYEADFVRFVKDQYRLESQSTPGVRLLLYGLAYIDSNGNVIRGALNNTFLSESDFELFAKLAF